VQRGIRPKQNFRKIPGWRGVCPRNEGCSFSPYQMTPSKAYSGKVISETYFIKIKIKIKINL
jgi:hypothetical protein